MKKLVKNLLLSLTFLICLIGMFGCSCSSLPMNVSFNVMTIESGMGSANMEVTATVTKKFREPFGTPCYMKVEPNKYGYAKIVEIAEIDECFDTGDCYKKVSKGNYQKITSDVEIQKCIINEMTCYEKTDVTYYRLLQKAEEISDCYDAEGNYFEKATYNKAEKKELLSLVVTSKKINRYSFSSTVEEVPSNNQYSLIYQFDIKNNESSTIYIEALDFDGITTGIIKEKSYSKIRITDPTNKKLLDNKVYYVVGAGKTVTLKIEIKGLKSSDAVKNKKDLSLYIPLIVR